MVRWYHQVNRHEFEQTPVDSEGQGNLACCSPWSCEKSRRDLVSEQQESQKVHHDGGIQHYFKTF